MKTFLDEIGINIMQSIAGLFGSLLLLGKGAAIDVKQSFFSIVAGVASANYITPVVSMLLKVSEEKYQNGIAFIMGFLGLKGVEAISKRLLNKM